MGTLSKYEVKIRKEQVPLESIISPILFMFFFEPPYVLEESKSNSKELQILIPLGLWPTFWVCLKLTSSGN